MKTIFGVLASVLLVTTLAFGQQWDSNLPFPQGANPALQNGTYAPAVANQNNLPPSMATNQNFPVIYPQRHNAIETGSPFPTAADPSTNTNNDIPTSIEGRNFELQTGSPFPMAAAPSNNQ